MPVSATSCDLHIKLELVRARSVEDPYAFQMGPQKYILRSGGDSLAESTLDWNAQLLAKLAALRNPGSDPALAQELGEMLREFLIPIGWQGYAGKLLASDRENKQSAVTIRSHASELYALPWELLTVGATGQRLAEIRGVLLRYQWPQTVTTPESGPRPEGSRILVAWSAAGGGVPAAEHVQAIDRACRTADLRVDELCEVLPNASARQLIERLESASRAGRPISVLHLLCHGRAVGSTYGLSLDTDDSIGSAQAVDAAWLRRVVRKYAATLRLLVLCACDSGNSGVHGNYLGSLAQEVFCLSCNLTGPCPC